MYVMLMCILNDIPTYTSRYIPPGERVTKIKGAIGVHKRIRNHHDLGPNVRIDHQAPNAVTGINWPTKAFALISLVVVQLRAPDTDTISCRTLDVVQEIVTEGRVRRAQTHVLIVVDGQVLDLFVFEVFNHAVPCLIPAINPSTRALIHKRTIISGSGAPNIHL